MNNRVILLCMVWVPWLATFAQLPTLDARMAEAPAGEEHEYADGWLNAAINHSPELGIQHGDRVLAIIGKSDANAYAKAWTRILGAHRRLEDHEKTIEVADALIAWCKAPVTRPWLIRALVVRGSTCIDLAQYEVAEDYIRRAVDEAEKYGEPGLKATALNSLANLAYLRGMYEDALTHYLKVLDVRVQMGDKRWEASTLNNIGLVSSELSHFESALTYFRKALALLEEVEDVPNQADTLNNIGMVLSSLGKHEEALKYLERSLALEQQLARVSGQAYVLTDLGDVYFALKQYQKAEEVLLKSLEMRRELGSPDQICVTEIALGKVYMGTGDDKQALAYLEAALLTAIDLEIKPLQINAHQFLSDAYERVGNTARALSHYRKFKELSDEVYSQQSLAQINALQARFDADQREREIDLLKKDAQLSEMELKRQKGLRNWLLLISLLATVSLVLFYKQRVHKVRLAEERRHNRSLDRKVEERTHELALANESLQEKNEAILRRQEQLVAQEKMASLGTVTAGVAHEISNPLNFINNFSDIIDDLCGDVSEGLEAYAEGDEKRLPDIEADLTDIRVNVGVVKQHGQRVSRIVRSMISLMPGSKSILSAEQMTELVTKFTHLAINSLHGKHGELGVDLVMDLDTSLPPINVYGQDMGRLMVNLINNAVEAIMEKRKHQQEEWRGKVHVTLREEDRWQAIGIRDNGVGIPKEVQTSIMEPFVTTKATADGHIGLGLAICFDICRQHDGSLTIESEEGSYTQTTVRVSKHLKPEKAAEVT